MNNKLRNTFFNENLLAAFLLSVGCMLASSASGDVPRFLDPPFIATGVDATAMMTTDFNNDGIPDVGTINSYGNQIGVTMGNGDGTFQPTQIYNVSASDMKSADLNGDGKPDLWSLFTPLWYFSAMAMAPLECRYSSMPGESLPRLR